MKWAVALVSLTMLFASTACNEATGRFQPRANALRDKPANVVHFDGVGQVPFGAKLREVRDKLDSNGPGCNGNPSYSVNGYSGHVELIFDGDDKFVMAWVYSPKLHTSDELTIGSTIDDVHSAYPHAEEFAATDRSYPALLARSGDTGIMFLYEPRSGEVVKILAGYSQALTQGQQQGMSC